MIIDRIVHSHLYADLGPRIKRAFDYLLTADLTRVSEGTHEIDGRDVYAVVQTYTTKSRDQGRWEAHRRYIDLQYVVSGSEGVGYAHVDKLTPGEYDEAKDVLFLSGEGNFLALAADDFMILFPHDAHMPGLSVGEPAVVKKVVVKIRVV